MATPKDTPPTVETSTPGTHVTVTVDKLLYHLLESNIKLTDRVIGMSQEMVGLVTDVAKRSENAAVIQATSDGFNLPPEAFTAFATMLGAKPKSISEFSDDEFINEGERRQAEQEKRRAERAKEDAKK